MLADLGVARSSGEYLVFLDSDDLLLSDGVRLQASFLNNNPDVDLVYANGYTLTRDGVMGPLEPFVIPTPRLDRLDMYSRLVNKNLFALHAGMVRRTALPDIGPFDESLHALEDWDLWIRLAIAGSNIRYQDEKVVVYRRHLGNTRLDSRTELRSRVAIVRKIISGNLDFAMPERVRQNFRLVNLYAVLASRSLHLIIAALATILFPDRMPSLYGLIALQWALVTMAHRTVALMMNRGVSPLLKRLPVRLRP
jgi:glycosyltransferase involved in cell wall biosynthesis